MLRLCACVLLLGRLKPASRPLEPCPAELFDFFVASLPRLDPSWLEATAPTCMNKDLRPSEAFWQYACWTALSSALPREHMVPDVGHAFDEKGRVDFYINHLRGWGIELTREGSRLKEHYDRFFKGGVYHRMVEGKTIKQWLLVNFCLKRPRRDIHDARVVHVVYAPDYRGMAVWRMGQKVADIRLVGKAEDPIPELTRGMSQLGKNSPPRTPVK